MGAKIRWKSKELREAIAAGAVDGVTEIDLRIETEAKQELYPGHGLVTGTLRRAIQGAPGVLQGRKVRGKVGTKGVRYAKVVHRKYQYLLIAFRRVKPQSAAILQKHVTKRAKG